MFLAQRGCTCLAAQLASIATRSFSRITVSNSTFHLLNNASNRQSIFNISGDTIARSFASKASDTSSGNGQDKSSKQTTEECKPDASCQSSLTLNSSCIKRLQELNSGSDVPKYLRVTVDSGGCSGLEYKFTLDTHINADDVVVEKDGCKLLVDTESLPFINGSTVDFYEELIRSGFRVLNNPRSEHACSCGSSFSIKV